MTISILICSFLFSVTYLKDILFKPYNTGTVYLYNVTVYLACSVNILFGYLIVFHYSYCIRILYWSIFRKVPQRLKVPSKVITGLRVSNDLFSFMCKPSDFQHMLPIDQKSTHRQHRDRTLQLRPTDRHTNIQTQFQYRRSQTYFSSKEYTD